MKARYFLVIVLFFQFIVALPQKPPIKYGEVDMADLEMTSYPKDTSAPAVILCDYGYFSANLFQFHEIRRIKILKKEGYSYATYVLPGKFKYAVKGMTINLENGKIVKEKVKSESVFETLVTTGVYETRIAMPNVKVGSILDMDFTYEGLPFQWEFQDRIPVRYSELTIENSTSIRFKSNFFGYEPLAVTSPGHWIARDMPAFKEEAYINSAKNYMSRSELDLLQVGIVAYAATWEDVVSTFRSDHNFLFFYPMSPQLNEMAKKIKESGSSKEVMMRDAFEAVKTVKWNENASVYTSNQTLNYILRMKIGNSADINSLLYELLKKLEIEVYPVAISTRENGTLSQFSASLFKFNYLLVLAKIGDKSYLLDATEQYNPYYLLPFRCLNSQGRIIDVVNNGWIDLKPERKDKEIITYDLKLDEELALKGTLSYVMYDYSAFNFRKAYRKFNSKEAFLDDYRTNKSGLIINDYSIENLDSIYLPVSEKFDITAGSQVIESGDEFIIIPLLYNQMKENPFISETRKYPVDYGYNKESIITTKLIIPDNLTLMELPKPLEIKLTDNSASFRYESKISGNEITITSCFNINKPVFYYNEYSSLRGLYNQMIKKHSEPVILKKK